MGNFLNTLGNDFMKYTPTGRVLDAAFGSTPHTAAPPGAASGPPPDPSRLQHRPDGTAVDPVTGQTYVNTPDKGLVAQGTANVQQQSGNALNQAAGFYGQVPGYDQREQAAYGQEGALAGRLNGIVNGTGPTVAGTQLAVGMDQAQRSQLAQAAGASGNGAALARMTAAGNTGQLQAQTNQQQAVARAGEETNAINSLAGLTGNMEGQSAAAAGQKIGAGQALTSMAMGGEGQHESDVLNASKANAAADAASKARWLNMASSAVSSGASLG